MLLNKMRPATEHRKEIEDELGYMEGVFKQQFKFTSKRPSMMNSSELEHAADNLTPVLDKCAEDVEIKGERLFHALRHTGLGTGKLMKLKKSTKEIVASLKELRDYFSYLKKSRGKLPQFIPAATLGRILSLGIYKGTNRLVKLNDEPMMVYVNGLNRTFIKTINKVMATF